MQHLLWQELSPYRHFFINALNGGAWIATIMITMTALYTGACSVEMPSAYRVVVIAWMVYAPIIEPASRNFSAAEAVAAECNCQNRIQLEVQSDVVGIRRADPGGSNNTGNSCTQSADNNIAQENDALGIDARDAGSLLIDADALDI